MISFRKLLRRKRGSKPVFFSGKVECFLVTAVGAAFSRVYFPRLFFGIWFGCFVLFITHSLPLKKSHVRACWETDTLNVCVLSFSLDVSNTHAHTLNSMGDVFPVLCMV